MISVIIDANLAVHTVLPYARHKHADKLLGTLLKVM